MSRPSSRSSEKNALSPITRIFNLFAYVGFRHLKMRPIRSLLTTLGVSLGIALFIGIRIINQSTLASFKENVEAIAGKATLTVTAGEFGFDENLLDVIQKVPGVKHAIPMVESHGYLASSGTNQKNTPETLFVLGVDLLKEQAVRTYKTEDEQIIDDPLVFLNQPDSIIVTHEFAKNHHLKIDSKFAIATATGKKTFTVRGLLSPVGPAKAYGGSLAIMDIDGARMTFGKEGKLDRVDLVLREGSDISEVGKRIEEKLGSGYQVVRPATQSEGMAKMVQSYQTMMTFFSTLALLVGLFLITNSISISVAERKKEIGTLRALGSSRPGILTLFLTEAVAMGLVGSLLGVGLGRVLASFLMKIVSQSMSSQYLTKIEISRLQFGAADILQALWIGAFAALVAAAWPAFRATRIQPLEAMKNAEVGKEAASSGFLRWAPYVGGLLIVGVTLSAWLGLPTKYPLLEHLDQGFSIIGAAFLGPSVVILLVRLVRPIAIPFGGPVTRLAQDNLIRNPKRTASNVMSLMVGLILVILIAAVNQSFSVTIQEWFDRIIRSDLVVSSTGQLISYQTQPLHESVGRELEKVKGVAMGERFGAYGVRFVHILYEGKKIAVKANDEPYAAAHYSTLDVLDRPREEAGRELFHSADPVLMVSENFVLHFGKKTGDHISVDTPTGKVDFRIVGVMKDYASDVGVFYLNRDQYRTLWRDPLVSVFGLHIAPGFRAEEVRAEIDRQFGQSRNLMVVSNAELKKEMNRIIDQSFANTRAVEGAALLVGLLGLLNTLLISVMERMREIGMLRAIGMSQVQVSRMIFQEALFQGGLGAVTAVALGGWLGYVWITFSLSRVLGGIVQFHFPWMSILTTVLTGLVVATVAGFFPARRAARMEITEALDYE